MDLQSIEQKEVALRDAMVKEASGRASKKKVVPMVLTSQEREVLTNSRMGW